MIASTALVPDVLRALPTGTVVRLPDDELAVVNWSSHSEVHVVQPQRVLGRGPWIFHRQQVVPATPAERLGYWERYFELLRSQGAGEWQLANILKLAEQARMEVRP